MGAGRFSVVELVERLQEEPRLRHRAAALAAVTVFFATGLFVVGLGEVVLLAIGLAAVGGLLVLGVRHLSLDALRRILRNAWSEERRQRLSTLAAGAVASARSMSMNATRRVPPPAEDEFYGWPYAGSDEIADAPRRAEPRVDEERRRALELNAQGSNLRRAGSPAEAAALHAEALDIFKALDDRRAQAQTLNSLALALAADGETDTAVERFEESLSILREHPDDPGEAEVIANLGFTLLQQGGDERARELLSEALEKLPPDSRAAHKVEAQLRRAS